MIARLRHLFFPHRANNLRSKLLHLPSLAILITMLAFSQLGISVVQRLRPDVLGYASQIPVESIVTLTNERRAEYNLPSLRIDPRLSDAARRKASDMFANNYWAHNSPSGIKPWFFIIATGYSYLHAGENLARDFAEPNSVVSAWMNSPTHRDNLLSPKYRDIGVAVVDGYLNGVETTLVVQMFGTLAATSPQVDQEAQAIVRQVEAAAPSPIQAVQGEVESLIPTQVATPVENKTPETAIIMPTLSSFAVSRSVSLAFAFLLLVVLGIDWLVAWQQNFIRLSGKNWAHITYLLITIILGLIIKQGMVL